ncbi:MAG TPA: entericidin A/B family lipoprotein [Amaricoccus sp.]|nr:entericidin A/B family lipoprotein [Amaricoccus sp.]
MSKFLLAAGLALMTLAACNTVKGAGKDVTAAGQAVQQEAGEAQSSM